MPIFGNNTSPSVSEPLGGAEFAFTTLVRSMQTLCAAERDIAGISSGDFAFDDWFRDAEVARSAVVSAAEAVILVMAPTATDRRFRIVALNFEALLLTKDAAKYAFLAEALSSTAWFYTVPGRGPRAARATALLQTFRHYFGLLLSFSDYTPEPPFAPAMAMAMAA
ncbi:MAG: hypothetical protein U0934_20790 [Pseudotabrizicola sp.]|uniref:hypothetical protein n=1 Tax=Pseudotabrizicola sp. TaxID=2939647 RepID=UPI0027305E6E|nr:hypothetical protein [Pseudotabrizicola sp.]MDP2079593.1 hypothetical protein [Pseudotabrizicola sp.]MDZ7576362.1 hypothetical protein [Pseudotabrizicola sp.]